MNEKYYALRVKLALSPEKLERMYAGSAKSVLAYTHDGRSIRFPVGILRPFVTYKGVNGEFKIIFDVNHKFIDIEQISQ